MDILVTDRIINILLIASTFSFILMALVQKMKSFQFIRRDCHVLVCNVLLSMVFGTLFAASFYNLNIIDSLWVGFFAFVEAPALYKILKNQNIINYTPASLDDINKNVLMIPSENEIKRGVN